MASESLDASLSSSDSESSPRTSKKRPSTPFKDDHFKRSCMKLYLQEETADVHFVFHGEEKRLPAHKYMLGIGSPVFQSMFYGTLKEEGDVKIIDATMDAFKEFLQFFYTDQVIITIENVAEVMNLINKYSILTRFDICDKFLMTNLSIKNICMGLELAITFDRRELLHFCMKKIMEKPVQLFASDSFQKCSPELLKLILKGEQFKCGEKAIFEACMAWSVQACIKKNLDESDMANIRAVLGDCFNLIQFAAMKPEHISKCMSKYNNLFQREELLDIIAILSPDNKTKLQCFTNNTRMRNAESKQNSTMIFTQIDAPVDYVKKVETTYFKTNKELLLGGIATGIVDPWKDTKKEPSSIVKIIDSNDKELLSQPLKIDYRMIPLNGKIVPRNVNKLNKIISIQPNTKYGIRIEFDSSWSHEAYVTKKCTVAHEQLHKDIHLVIGGGIISHLYFKSRR